MPQELAARIDELRRRMRRAWEHWNHLQEAFADPESPEFWVWVNTHGYKDLPELRELLIPVPPPEIYRFSNTSDEWGYLLTAGATHTMVDGILEGLGTSWEEQGPVLDFGCGPGRGLRCLLRHALDLEAAGCDVDAAAIAWCREAFPFGEFQINGEHPPLGWADASFGLVFSVSVFSHLGEANHLTWLQELRRVLRPGGLAILTIHGEHALRRVIEEPEVFEMIEVDRPGFEAARNEAQGAHGFGFVPQPRGHLTTDLYGVAFMSREYVAREWSRHFEIVDHRVAAIDDWQDAIVLRAP